MTRSMELDELVSNVEDLLAQLPNNLTPELAALRDKVDAGIFDAWTAVAADNRDRLNSLLLRRDARLRTTVGLAFVLAVATSLLAYRIRSRHFPA